MRNYKAKEYIDLVENIKLHGFIEYMSDEVNFIKSIDKSEEKTFIELGAGYGRVFPYIKDSIAKYIGIEINPQMSKELSERADMDLKMVAIENDIKELNDYLEIEKENDIVLLMLQNTLGSLEGDIDDVLNSLKFFFKYRKCDFIISVLKADKLKSFGLKFYDSIKPICGIYDSDKSDLEHGIFITDSGYKSKWWNKAELEKIIKYLGATSFIIQESENAYFVKAYFR